MDEDKKVEEQSVEPTQDERIDALSRQIFGKPAKDIKYLLCTQYIHEQLLDEELARTGLYQWVNAFKGEVKYPVKSVPVQKDVIVPGAAGVIPTCSAGSIARTSTPTFLAPSMKIPRIQPGPVPSDTTWVIHIPHTGE